MSNLVGLLFGFNSVQRPQDVKGAGTSAIDVKKGEGTGFQSLLQLFSSRMVSKLGTIKNNQMIDAGPNTLEREKEGPDETRKGKIPGSSDHRPSDGRKNKNCSQLKVDVRSPFQIPLSDGGWMESKDIDFGHMMQSPFSIEGEGKNIIEGNRSLPELSLKMTKGKAFIWKEGEVKGAVVDFSGIMGEGVWGPDSDVPKMLGPEDVKYKQQDQEGVMSHGIKTKKTSSIKGNEDIQTKTILKNISVEKPLDGSAKRVDSLPSVKVSQKSMFQKSKGLNVQISEVQKLGKGAIRISSIKRNQESVPNNPKNLNVKEIKSEVSVENPSVGGKKISSQFSVMGFKYDSKNTPVSNPVPGNEIEIAQKENVGMAEKSDRTGLQGGQRGPAPEHFQIVDGERHLSQDKILRSNDKMDDESGSKSNLKEGKGNSHFLKMSVQRGTMQGKGFQDRLSKVSRSNPVSVPIKGEMANEGLRVGRESITSEVGVKGFQTVPKNTAASNPVQGNEIEVAQRENVGTAEKSDRTGLQGGQRGPAPEHFQMVDGERHPSQGKILRSNNKMDDESGSKSNLKEGEGKRHVLKMSTQRGTMQGETFQNRLSIVSRSNPVSVPPKGEMSNSSPLRDSIMDQIASSMTNTIRAGRSRVTIILRPEEMGRLRMELISKNGIIEAKFFVESNEVKQMIEGSLSDLKTGLEKEGVQVENFNVDVDREFSHLSGQHERLTKKDNPYSRQDKRAKGDASREEKEREGHVRQRYFGYNSMEILA